MQQITIKQLAIQQIKRMKIIPAIDLIDGKCVRLTQGNYAAKTIYNENPLEVAKEYEANGIQYLHLVDLDGAKAGKIINWKVLESICNNTTLQVDFGGGLQSNQDLQTAFENGAKQITAGSIAIRNRALVLEWIEQFGAEKIILGADVKNEMIAISGWQEITQVSIFDFLEDYLAQGIQTVICTDIQKDGLLQGVSLDLYLNIQQKFPKLQLIASGGVAGMEDIEKLAQNQTYGVIIGKALYEGKISLDMLKTYFS